jgi:hypothetical protein
MFVLLLVAQDSPLKTVFEKNFNPAIDLGSLPA